MACRRSSHPATGTDAAVAGGSSNVTLPAAKLRQLNQTFQEFLIKEIYPVDHSFQARRSQFPSVSLEEVQSTLLTNQSVILEFVFGHPCIYVVLVFPSRSPIIVKARSSSEDVLQGLRQFHWPSGFKAKHTSDEKEERKTRVSIRANQVVKDPMQKLITTLSSMLSISEVMKHLFASNTHYKELLIFPHHLLRLI